MNLRRIVRRLKLGKEVATLLEAGYLTEGGALTDVGKSALWSLILDSYQTELVAVAREELEEAEAEEKKNAR